jgi:hypothetical protein
VNSNVTIGGFKAAGLWVKVYLFHSKQNISPLFDVGYHIGLYRLLNNTTRPTQGPDRRHAQRHSYPTRNRPVESGAHVLGQLRPAGESDAI